MATLFSKIAAGEIPSYKYLIPIDSEADVDFHHHVKLSDEEMKATADKIYAAFKAE